VLDFSPVQTCVALTEIAFEVWRFNLQEVIEKLNLATHPYRNRALPYVLAALVFSLTFLFGTAWMSQWQSAKSEEAIIKTRIEDMETSLAALNLTSEKVQQSLSPEQRSLLVAAHKLVSLKSFAWSRLLSDLESLLPGSVSASRLSVQNVYKTSDGRIQAELEFSVLSRNYQTVINMIDAMNSSGIFQAELRGQDLQKGDYFTFSEYSIRLLYTPRYGYAESDGTTIASANNSPTQ
jgi:Tfp pilus assembly protein PilN